MIDKPLLRFDVAVVNAIEKRRVPPLIQIALASQLQDEAQALGVEYQMILDWLAAVPLRPLTVVDFRNWVAWKKRRDEETEGAG